MKKVIEPSREIPVINEVDIVVVGGGCTGVFAAIRAARLGAKVAIIEGANVYILANGGRCGYRCHGADARLLGLY